MTADAAVPVAVRFPVKGEVEEEVVVFGITGGRVAYGVWVWMLVWVWVWVWVPDAEAEAGAAAGVATEVGGRVDETEAEAEALGLLGAGRILVGCCCC